MTEKIQHTIQEISRKTQLLGEELRSVRSKNEELQAEIAQKNEQLLAETSLVNQLRTEIESLNTELEMAKNKVVENPVSSIGRNEQEIDELVKEIEYCIEQLKQS